jgi:hypothetical protein
MTQQTVHVKWRLSVLDFTLLLTFRAPILRFATTGITLGKQLSSVLRIAKPRWQVARIRRHRHIQNVFPSKRLRYKTSPLQNVSIQNRNVYLYTQRLLNKKSPEQNVYRRFVSKTSFYRRRSITETFCYRDVLYRDVLCEDVLHVRHQFRPVAIRSQIYRLHRTIRLRYYLRGNPWSKYRVMTWSSVSQLRAEFGNRMKSNTRDALDIRLAGYPAG